MGRGKTRQEAIDHIKNRLESRTKEMEKNKPMVDEFLAKHGLKTQDELDMASIRWVLGNPDMHTVCVAMPDFDKMDMMIPLSGTELSAREARLLDDYRLAFGSSYCRHGCNECQPLCPFGVPVSTVMRYSYYFQHQKREKYAMEKYAKLGNKNGLFCLDCEGPCFTGCPFGVNTQAAMIKAHGMLTLA
jgi:predicted aldo/keto reductase-like oxidoreductase